MSLFALTVTPTAMTIIGLSAALAVFLVAWFFRKDTAIEGRRREMSELTYKLKELGLGRLSEITEAYSVGDYSGLLVKVRSLLREMMDAEDAMSLLSKSFFLQLPKRLENEGDRQKILKQIEQFKAARPELFAEVVKTEAVVTAKTAVAA
uniref:Uncharacterized protein n=1 Tax=viral metagenome TaxID=1070528 RepID=A0A6M3L549_9ZZZZ